MGIVVAGIVVVCILVAAGFYFFRKRSVSNKVPERSSDDRSRLLDQFKATQQLALRVYRELYIYVELNNAHNQFIQPGITYHQALEQLKSDQKTLYSDAIFKELSQSANDPSGFQSRTQTLKEAFDVLSLMDQDTKFKASYTL